MSWFEHSFEGPLSLLDVGKSRTVTYHVLFLPATLEPVLPFSQYPRLRVEGEIADCPVRGAWIPVGDGRRYFIVSPTVRKDSGARPGDVVGMRFRVDDQDHVDIQPGLATALRDNDLARDTWDQLTSGKKRMYAAHVASAKTAPTEARRLSEALEAMSVGMSVRDFQRRR